MSLNRIMLVGEAWGEQEEAAQAPFVGPSGRILDMLLRMSGIRRDECYLTNVFNLRPQPKNDIDNLCGPKADGIPGLPSLRQGKYVRAEYAPELERLYREIERVRPNVVVALGASAAWALLRSSGIKKVRGAVAYTDPNVAIQMGGFCPKVLPTYHPAAVMREWKLRPIVMKDLEKALRESEFPELRRLAREVWIEPTISDLLEFDHYITNAKRLSIDIETYANQITCIGFAPSIDRALVVPFFAGSSPSHNYWPTLHDELVAWDYVKRWCQHPCVLGQNIIYDMHFLWRSYGIAVPGQRHDTMLLHHALQPEMEKGLGFLGSVYTDEASWKIMRTESETMKREE